MRNVKGQEGDTCLEEGEGEKAFGILDATENPHDAIRLKVNDLDADECGVTEEVAGLIEDRVTAVDGFRSLQLPLSRTALPKIDGVKFQLPSRIRVLEDGEGERACHIREGRMEKEEDDEEEDEEE